MNTLPQEAAVSAADFHAFKSIPLSSHELGHECVCEGSKRCVSTFVSVGRLGGLSEGRDRNLPGNEQLGYSASYTVF